MMTKKHKAPKEDCPSFDSFEEFESLSAEDKDRVSRLYDRKIPQSEMRPLTRDERTRFKKIQRRSVGRPKVGQGAKVVAVTLEKGLLKRVDDYARQHEMKRAEMITRGLLMVMGRRRVGVKAGENNC